MQSKYNVKDQLDSFTCDSAKTLLCWDISSKNICNFDFDQETKTEFINMFEKETHRIFTFIKVKRANICHEND